MTRVNVIPDWQIDGIKVAVVQEGGDYGPRVLRIERGMEHWEPLEPGVQTEPTIYLSDDVARPLLDALVRHYHGGEDTRQLRKDYDAERTRVDLLIRNLTGPLS